MRVVEHGPLSAIVAGRRMPRWFIDERGHRYEFKRIAEENRCGGFDLKQLTGNQCILAPGVIYERIPAEDFSCTSCGDDEAGLVNDKTWGWVCDDCKQQLDKIDRETDWESWDEERRRKLAEANEY